MSSIHRTAEQGFTAGAATYVSGRPDYPAAVVGWLGEELGLGDGKTALDLGAGTGKFLPFLLATGAKVLAVEPVAAMREQLARGQPDVRVLSGAAEAIPLPDASLDAVACAQAFHWFASGAALAEIRRVLKPGGALGLVWNIRETTAPWMAALSAIMEPYQGDAPRYQSQAWRTLFPAPGYGPLSERRFSHAHAGSAQQVVVDRALSVSFIAALPPDQKAAVEQRLHALIEATPELRDRAQVSAPYATFVYACRKLA